MEELYNMRFSFHEIIGLRQSNLLVGGSKKDLFCDNQS